ncbi:MAG: helicase [Pseudobdellovibrio sp.]|jgi:superfamily II DNA/RNA helicase|nr:helicase [Pseudobdellovibrio sp.]
MNTFPEFGLLPSILKTLKAQKIYTPTEIQRNAIPLLMSGQSVVGVSETGSGKTLTYALPILHLLKTLENEGVPVEDGAKPRALILVPSRDLGEQVSKVFKTFTHDTRLRVRPVLGGTTFEQSRRSIEAPFEILLATPGRLIQLMDKDMIDLSDVAVIVFDEADQMLDDGFISESKRVVNACDEDTQLALFSATVSLQVQDLMNALFKNAEVIRSSGAGKVVKTLVTKNETVIDGLRWPIFEKLIKQKTAGGTIVFTNTREQCDKLAAEIEKRGYECVVYRGEMDKGERRSNLKKFRNGEVNLLISTDLAARGLDLDYVGRVINYHLPQDMSNYLHRVGRTARAGKHGLVVNLVTERDLPLISKLEGKNQSVRELKSRFKDRDGKRLHVSENLRKPKESKPIVSPPKTKPAGRKFSKPKFKPKPYNPPK